jgi:hypothetical protein
LATGGFFHPANRGCDCPGFDDVVTPNGYFHPSDLAITMTSTAPRNTTLSWKTK